MGAEVGKQDTSQLGEESALQRHSEKKMKSHPE